MYFGIKGVPVETLRQMVRLCESRFDAMVLLSPEMGDGRRYVRVEQAEAVAAVRQTLVQMHASVVEANSLPGGKRLGPPTRTVEVKVRSKFGPKSARAMDEAIANMIREDLDPHYRRSRAGS